MRHGIWLRRAGCAGISAGMAVAAAGTATAGDDPGVNPTLAPLIVSAPADVDRAAIAGAFACLGVADTHDGCRAVSYESGEWFDGSGPGIRLRRALAERVGGHPARGALLLAISQIADAHRYQYAVALHTVTSDVRGKPVIGTRYGVSYVGTADRAAAAPAAVSAVLAAMLAPNSDAALSNDRDTLHKVPRLRQVIAADRPACRNPYGDWRFVRAVGDQVWVRADIEPKFGPLVFVTLRCYVE